MSTLRQRLFFLYSWVQSAPRSTWLATLAALIGAVLWSIGLYFAIASFDQHNAVPYSCWNHVISELGFPFASPLTWVFNGTVAMASLTVLPTLYALSAHLRTRLGNIAAGFGMVACVALSGMGIFGLRQDIVRSPYILIPFLRIHLALAGVFFLGWVVAVTLFAIVLGRRWKDPASKAMAIVGIVCALLYPAFILSAICPDGMQRALSKDLKTPAFRAILNSPSSAPLLTQWLDMHRPHVWRQAAFEWVWSWSILLWLGMALVFLWMRVREAVKPAL